MQFLSDFELNLVQEMFVKTVFASCQLRDNWFSEELTSRRGPKWISIRFLHIYRPILARVNYVKCYVVELLFVSSYWAL